MRVDHDIAAHRAGRRRMRQPGKQYGLDELDEGPAQLLTGAAGKYVIPAKSANRSLPAQTLPSLYANAEIQPTP
jgi:hypothetical protein